MEATEFKEHLEKNLIPFWNAMKDETNGGFYGYADCNGNPDYKSDKGCILNSRILWFYSSAYMLLKNPLLLEMAEHACKFLLDYCMDSQYGGVFWSVHYDGTYADETKHTYNQAFAIYALSAYYRASGDRNALDKAYELYHLIEDKCNDGQGYLESFHRDFSPAPNDKLSENGVLAERTMNTLLHVMEAYSELYYADSSSEVKNSLQTILGLFKSKIYNKEKQICDVFFDMDYHSIINLESFGHDIEASWLIDRGCNILNDTICSAKMHDVINGLAEGAYNDGIDTSKRAMNNEAENGIIDQQKIWWVQAESVVGFYNAYKQNPRKTEYLKAAEDIWSYIRTNVIDKKSGEWIESISADGTINSTQALAHQWKCPYHNGRMCIEMIQRLS